MKIPNNTTIPRYYIARSIRLAVSSHESLKHAKERLVYIKEKMPWVYMIVGIVETDRTGKRWIEQWKKKL